MPDNRELANRRILVVEDEMLVSLLIEEVLTDNECIIVGPYDRDPGALEAARTLDLDAAVLDVNLAGTKVYPVAKMLWDRRIPLLLLSGYAACAVPVEHTTWPVCSKPFRAEALIAMLAEHVAARHRRAISRQS